MDRHPAERVYQKVRRLINASALRITVPQPRRTAATATAFRVSIDFGETLSLCRLRHDYKTPALQIGAGRGLNRNADAVTHDVQRDGSIKVKPPADCASRREKLVAARYVHSGLPSDVYRHSATYRYTRDTGAPIVRERPGRGPRRGLPLRLRAAAVIARWVGGRSSAAVGVVPWPCGRPG